MIIENPKQFESFRERSEVLLRQVCQYEDESNIPSIILEEYKAISDAIIEYESVYHPLPKKISTLNNSVITNRKTKAHLKEKILA